jgi:hypothetical protein
VPIVKAKQQTRLKPEDNGVSPFVWLLQTRPGEDDCSGFGLNEAKEPRNVPVRGRINRIKVYPHRLAQTMQYAVTTFPFK